MDMVRLLVRVMLVHVGMGMGMSDRAVGMHVMVELPLPPSDQQPSGEDDDDEPDRRLGGLVHHSREIAAEEDNG
jgi:hypothetical protein